MTYPAQVRARLRARREESGATAVIVGIMAALLFSMAGMAVDLGNAWARGRSSQEGSDLSAISAGHLLPATASNRSAIAAEVAARLNANEPPGQPDATGPGLLDGDPKNGEVTFSGAGGTPCTDTCVRMTVTPPAARVDFTFAAVMGFSGTTVQRPATVEVQSPLPRKQYMIPFWLPSGCGYGPTQADTTQGGSQPGPAVPEAYAAPAAARAQVLTGLLRAAAPSPSPVGTHTIGGAPEVTAIAGSTTQLEKYSVSGVQSQYKKVSLRAFAPDGTSYIDFSAQTTGDGALPTMQIGPGDVTGTVGDWYVFALAYKDNSDLTTKGVVYSTNYITIHVTGTAPSPTPSPTPTPTPTPSPSPNPTASASPTGVANGCVGQDRGNFGQLSSPRQDQSNLQQAFPRNIAAGLDHTLVPYVFPTSTTPTKDCGSGASLLPGAKPDTTAGAAGDGTNCIQGDTGNDGPKTYAGLLTGVDELKGRLNVANGTTTCPGRSNLTVGGASINNDTLACFLRGGATLSGIAADTGVTDTMLDPAVTRSPRFVWLPVVYANDRAQKNFQPIRQFVPGFITSETQTSGPVDGTGMVNGLEINGNSVKVLHVFTFNPGAVVFPEKSDTTTYSPVLGSTTVRLVG